MLGLDPSTHEMVPRDSWADDAEGLHPALCRCGKWAIGPRGKPEGDEWEQGGGGVHPAARFHANDEGMAIGVARRPLSGFGGGLGDGVA